MKVKKNLIKYKDPSTGKYVPIPAVVGVDVEEEFELIESFEVTEEIKNFIRTAEPDGTPYDFQKVKVIVKQTKSEGIGKGGIRCDDPALNLGSIYIASSLETFNSRCTFSQYIGYIDNGLLKGKNSSYIATSDAPDDINEALTVSLFRTSNVSEPVFSLCETVKLDRIEYLRYGSLNSHSIPVGTKIDIYAVRS